MNPIISDTGSSPECGNCDYALSRDWYYCPSCGEHIDWWPERDTKPNKQEPRP